MTAERVIAPDVAEYRAVFSPSLVFLFLAGWVSRWPGRADEFVVGGHGEDSPAP